MDSSVISKALKYSTSYQTLCTTGSPRAFTPAFGQRIIHRVRVAYFQCQLAFAAILWVKL